MVQELVPWVNMKLSGRGMAPSSHVDHRKRTAKTGREVNLPRRWTLKKHSLEEDVPKAIGWIVPQWIFGLDWLRLDLFKRL